MEYNVQSGAVDITHTPRVFWNTRTAFLVAVMVKFSAEPTAAEDLEITHKSESGEDYDTLIFSADPGSDNNQNPIYMPENEIPINPGETLNITYPNTDNNRVNVTIKERY